MHKNHYFCNFLAKIIFLSKKFWDGIFEGGRPPHFIFYETRRPAAFENPVSEIRSRETNFLSFYKKKCKKCNLFRGVLDKFGIVIAVCGGCAAAAVAGSDATAAALTNERLLLASKSWWHKRQVPDRPRAK